MCFSTKRLQPSWNRCALSSPNMRHSSRRSRGSWAMHPEALDVVHRALAEDIGPGDVTSQACVPADRRASGTFLARQPMVLAGTDVVAAIYEARGGVEELTLLRKD